MRISCLSATWCTSWPVCPRLRKCLTSFPQLLSLASILFGDTCWVPVSWALIFLCFLSPILALLVLNCILHLLFLILPSLAAMPNSPYARTSTHALKGERTCRHLGNATDRVASNWSGPVSTTYNSLTITWAFLVTNHKRHLSSPI